MSFFIACGGGAGSPAVNAFTPSATTSTSPAPAAGTVSGGSGAGSTGSTPASAPAAGSNGSANSTPSSSPLPTPPSGATVLSNVQDTSDWTGCSDCAGGGSSTSNYWSAPFQTTPSMSGSSRQFHISGPAWSSVLWYKQLGAHDSASHFLWDFWVYLDSASSEHAWSAEYDLWQSIGGQEMMIGSQCDFGDGTWDLWDSQHGKWVKDTGVPCSRFSPGKWHHIQWYLERVSSTEYKYVTLVVDDKPYNINRTFTSNASGWGSNFGVQWQLDENSSGTALNEWVDKVTITVW